MCILNKRHLELAEVSCERGPEISPNLSFGKSDQNAQNKGIIVEFENRHACFDN